METWKYSGKNIYFHNWDIISIPYFVSNLFFLVILWYRKAVANALAAAPSMWTLGNAGMGALQVVDSEVSQ